MEESKVFMLPDNTSGNGCDNAAMYALMNNNNNWMNNPFMYLIWLAFFGGGNGFGWGNRGQESDLSRQIQTVQGTITDNHNNDLAMQAINGNGKALSELAGNLNVGVATLGNAISSIKGAIDLVGANNSTNAQGIINSVLLGNKDLVQQIASCCCENKQLVTTMGYEGQLRDQTNTCAITTRIGELANGVQQGFASIGYNQATNTNSIIQAGNNNTQRILDTLNSHWQSDLQQRYSDARLELSQQAQNAYLISQLKTT